MAALDFLIRPSLEYQHACDLCASEVQRCGGPAILRASSPFYGRELLKRCDALRPAQVVTEGMGEELQEILRRLGPEVDVVEAWSIDVSQPRPGGGLWAETAGVAGLGTPGGPPAGVALWAEPEAGDGDRALEFFDRYLAAGGRLCVVTSGWLRRGLPEWNGQRDRPARQPAGLLRTLRRLRQAGFAIEAVRGFHGPQSLAWGAASRLPTVLGREDWVDRCYAAVRESYVVRGWQALAAPVSVILARKR